ncbi:hypothetical protein FSC37_09235 [Piscinibacter aquaticus]|uniref:Uncharacterized protein n=1 Tax=Piscinibacter aquaticus TaxID=392597 RepID=A0A5C6TZ64_9BURK|nr:hypothetical protein FSC37_09235 [Piscinibacter aquaticus]
MPELTYSQISTMVTPMVKRRLELRPDPPSTQQVRTAIEQLVATGLVQTSKAENLKAGRVLLKLLHPGTQSIPVN